MSVVDCPETRAGRREAEVVLTTLTVQMTALNQTAIQFWANFGMTPNYNGMVAVQEEPTPVPME